MGSNGKYELVYRAKVGKKSAEGDVRKVKAGDVVSYFDNGWRTVEVEKVTGQFAKKVKIKPILYNGQVVRLGKVLQLGDIREVLRPLPSEIEPASPADAASGSSPSQPPGEG